MSETKIPSAEEIFQEEKNVILQESTYEFQIERVLKKIKKINKHNNTVTIVFKGLPDPRLLEELESQGYRVKFETSYDSGKQEKYLTRLRVINPKFENEGNSFIDKLEDQIKECAFSQGSFKMSDDAKNLIQSIFKPPTK
tara:strand:- start:61531 stop:61950 length:420 start_codon:yes stop_codon:yes gene_type:complete